METARNFDEAINRIHQENFCAIITDVLLADYDKQGFDGLKFIDCVVNINKLTPILVMSGFPSAVAKAKRLFGSHSNIRFLKKTDTNQILSYMDELSKNLFSH